MCRSSAKLLISVLNNDVHAVSLFTVLLNMVSDHHGAKSDREIGQVLSKLANIGHLSPYIMDAFKEYRRCPRDFAVVEAKLRSEVLKTVAERYALSCKLHVTNNLARDICR